VSQISKKAERCASVDSVGVIDQRSGSGGEPLVNKTATKAAIAARLNRQTLVLVHRWVGLTMTLFLFAAGLTGSLLAFYDELDHWLADEHFAITVPAKAQPLPPLVLFERINANLAPRAHIHNVPLDIPRDHALSVWVDANEDPVTGKPHELGFNEVMIDPYTGQITGQRQWGEFTLASGGLMPFLYSLHYTFAIPNWGAAIMGIIALLWAIDCFAGAYLTFPKGRPFVEKWIPAWQIKRGASFHRFNLDLHRASGLWLWAVLFIFAWSSVMFNLRAEVYRPVMQTMFEFQPDVWDLPKQNAPSGMAKLSPAQALRLTEQAAQQLAHQRGFTAGQPYMLYDLEEKNIYALRFKSSLDVGETAMTYVGINAVTGERLGAYLPSGEAAGDTVGSWLMMLHMGKVWGLPYRIFVCCLGLIVAALCVTGVVLWWKKRSARSKSAAVAAARSSSQINRCG
jgi:uncharacterized iron-regulated membrane protein